MDHAVPTSRLSPRLGGGLGLWLLTAVVVGSAGVLARLPVPPPAIALGLTATLVLLFGISPSLRRHAGTVGAGPLVGFHLVRIVAGSYFLVLWTRGSLPGSFAVPAGAGDLVIGASAILVLWRCVPARTVAQHRGLVVWNVLGLLDILLVLGNGMRLSLGDPAVGQAFTRLPLALLPTFIVPLVLSSHLLLLARARRPPPPHARIRVAEDVGPAAR